MNWVQKTPTELFKTIPMEDLEQLIAEKKHIKHNSHLSNLELLNNLMTRHILNKHHVPFFVSTKEDLSRWLFCIYVIE